MDTEGNGSGDGQSSDGTEGTNNTTNDGSSGSSTDDGTQGGTSTDGELGNDGKPFDAARAKATIDKLRETEKAGKAVAKERDELAVKVKENEDAQKTEAERNAERLEQLEADGRTGELERQELRLQVAVMAQASELGVVDVELALGAIDRSKIEFDEGEPTNVRDVLEDLLERKPILKGEVVASSDGGKNNDAGKGRKQGKAPNLSPAEAEFAESAGMTAERYEEMKKVGTLEDYLAVTTAVGDDD